MEPRPPLSRRERLALRVGLVALALGMVGSVLGTGTAAMLSGTASIGANTFATGAVSIGDNDAGAALLTLTNANAGDTTSGCIQVTYTGSATGVVHLYASVTGTGLGSYLDLVVTRGTVSSGAFPSCTNFTADASTYAAANGVVYTGTLATFTSTYTDFTSGLVDPTSGSPASWTNNTVHAYKFTVTLQNNNAAAGLTAAPTFTWEAQNA